MDLQSAVFSLSEDDVYDRLRRMEEPPAQAMQSAVDRVEKAFQNRPDPSLQWLHPGRVIMTIIMDGGGGCGKTNLSTDIVLPLLETIFHPEGVQHELLPTNPLD